MSAMKIAGFAIIAIIFAVPLFAQDFAPLPAPPSVLGVPFYLDISAGELKKLPMEPYKNYDPVPGIFTMSQALEVKGAASAFRIPNQNKIVFVYDATTIPRLYKFTVNGSKRKFEYGKVNVRNSTPVEGLTISISRYKETAFQFSSDQTLSPGEYAILFGDRLYTFGVDDKK
jgi:hypothetical protein